MSQIKYRISSISSQHPKYPGGNLTLNQQGWESGVNCVYPQSITIQFYIPIRTKKLHLLFHQYKIPRLVEVFVKLGSRANYRKLGHVVPNDNFQSSFEEKQEKTLYFEFSCTHIRFVLHQNYKNDMNIFNQVAMQDLIVIGQILSHKEMAGIDLTEEESSEDEATESIEIDHTERTLQNPVNRTPKQLVSNNSSSSPLFRDIYEKLDLEKDEAVAKQQYQKAAQIKSILNNFKNLQIDINRLQKQKMEALRKEDYDLCHRIKNQINKKKQVVQFQRESLFKRQQQFYSQNTYSKVVEKEMSPVKASKTKQNPSKDFTQFKSPEVDRLDVPQKLPQMMKSYDEQIIPALLNKGKQKYQNLPLQTSQKRKDYFVDIDQSIIPEQIGDQEYTSLRKDINEIRQLTDQEGDGSMVNDSTIEIQPLEMKLRMRIQNYFEFLPERWWEMCQNKNWRGKYEALKFLKEKIPEIQTKQHFMGVMEMISRIMTSKQAAISIEALQLLNTLTEIDLKFTLQHLPFFVEDIIGSLLNFLNDTNSKIKELAYVTYLHLPKISFLNISVVIRELIRHKNNVKNDPKLIITKLQLMTMIIETYREAQYNFKEIMNWTLMYFDDPNQKVRSTAAELLIALAYLIGSDKLLKAIEDMKKPELLEMVLNMMNTSFDHSKANIDQSKLSIGDSKLNNEFYGPSVGNKPGQSKSPTKVPPIQPIYVLSQHKQKMQQSKNSTSKRESDNGNFQLSYSRESMYEESLQPSNLNKIKKQQYQKQIQVLQDDDSESKICIYCMEECIDERTHYLKECKVLAHCQKCNSLVYLREFTEHLLQECEESHMFKICKKCGLAFEIGQINEHVAKDTCKKKLGLNWERCQFCCGDVFGQDKFWIEHALQCNSLPEKNYPQGDEEEDISMDVSQ